MARPAFAVRRERARIRRGLALGGRPCLWLTRRAASQRSQGIEERAVWNLRGVAEFPIERREEDHRATFRHREGVTPEAERVAEGEVCGEHGVRSLARKMRSRCGHAQHGDVELTLQVSGTS